MAEPDHRSGGRAVTADSKAQTPVRSAPVRSAPIRSAPLRRRRKADTSTPQKDATVTQAPDTPLPPDATVVTEDAVSPATETGPEQPVTVDPTPASVDEPTDSGGTRTSYPDASGTDTADPDELLASMSYRERRRRRAAAAGESAPAPAVTKVSALRSRSDRPLIAIVAMGLGVVVVIGCLVASAVFAIALGRIDHERGLRAEYSGFAQQMTLTMTSLNPNNVDSAMKTMSDRTSGTAQQRLNESMGQAVSLIRDQKLDVKSTVLSSAVTKATDTEGSVIVVYGWQMKPQDPKEETIIQTFRWRVDITRINGELKMTNFEWVT